jgi:hypothetical protein
MGRSRGWSVRARSAGRRAEQEAMEGPGMADKRNGSDRACRCRQAHVDCVGVAVQRLSQERVLELAEEIWTASGADKLPAVRATRDPRGSQPGASAQAAYRHCREQERGAWRHSLLWRAGAVAAAALGSGLLIGLAEGAQLGWRMAVVAAWAAGGADLFRRQRGDNRTSASARVWRRQAALQRRTAGALGSLTRDGYLVLHDVSLPGWPASLDHLVVGSTGVWVIHSWRRPWFARPRRTSSPEPSRGGFPLRPLGPRVEAEVVGQVLTATGARLHLQPLVCVHGGCGWRLGPPPSVQGVRLVSLRQLPDVIRHGDGTRAQQGQVDRVTARLLEVLGPAA